MPGASILKASNVEEVLEYLKKESVDVKYLLKPVRKEALAEALQAAIESKSEENLSLTS